MLHKSWINSQKERLLLDKTILRWKDQDEPLTQADQPGYKINRCCILNKKFSLYTICLHVLKEL